MKRLTEAELHDRRMWEVTAKEAGQKPDSSVLAMIEEIQERRAAEKSETTT